MSLNPETGDLSPVNFVEISTQLPELKRFDLEIKTISFSPPVDSSEVEPDMWIRLAATIGKHYNSFDGFVILHGTDTMAYSASALSFLLENLGKPVIFTGSQLPIGMLRTDGKENLISSIEIAAAKFNNSPVVPEVCVFFQNKLFRGNRTTKYNVEYFNAFRSDNYPPLAETGIDIKFNHHAIIRPPAGVRLKVHKHLDNNVAILKIFPGITKKFLSAVFSVEGLKGVIMETYGSGNAPTATWFISEIKAAVKKGITILNVSQCTTGSVDMSKYKTGKMLHEAGVLSGYDITTEAAVTKIMFLLAQRTDNKDIRAPIKTSIRGEIN
ncbi:MAG: type I asparaginase [Bacteroidales bacterium]